MRQSSLIIQNLLYIHWHDEIYSACHKQGAATTCYVATDPRLENVSGKFFADCNEMIPSKLASNPYEAQRLWVASEIMVSSQNPTTVFDLML